MGSEKRVTWKYLYTLVISATIILGVFYCGVSGVLSVSPPLQHDEPPHDQANQFIVNGELSHKLFSSPYSTFMHQDRVFIVLGAFQRSIGHLLPLRHRHNFQTGHAWDGTKGKVKDDDPGRALVSDTFDKRVSLAPIESPDGATNLFRTEFNLGRRDVLCSDEAFEYGSCDFDDDVLSHPIGHGFGGSVFSPKSTQARLVQKRLTELGYYSDSLSQKTDSSLLAAILLWQSANGLPLTGEIDEALLRRLKQENTIKAIRTSRVADLN